MKQNKCVDCIFSKFAGVPKLECRKNAPISEPGHNHECGRWLFPLVDTDGWCGQWEWNGKEVKK